MKIHIVQKGDTLWELSKKYGVDFEQLKQVNSQLSSPDMIMPGMKIKIPSSSKPVPKEGMNPKESQQPIATNPYKNTSPKPLPVIKEDDKEKPKPIQPQMPMQPKKEMPIKPQPQPKKEMPIQPQPQPQIPMQPIIQMPIMEQEMQNYTTINLPKMPVYHPPVEKPKEKPAVKEKMKPMPLPQPMHMVPLCCHVINPYCPPGPHDFFPVMGTFPAGHAPMAPMHMQHGGMAQPYAHGGHMMESPEMEMPVKPNYQAGGKDCGCKGKGSYPNQMGGYHMNNPSSFGGYDFNRQPGYVPQNYPPHFANVPVTENQYPKPPGPSFDYRNEEEDIQGE
ncbi:SafA/ExsA family spore coat assembly protein [Virgibacillus oceani]|uniref:LysM domain-containing protein n=1 Tax=Virgibacillus oceani TaxID=1479511 RepID=A0A917LW54_9BACI|nr:SafA/ExsA family spore coat assembly protein [Virgibacillus oceani]GGG62581.1 hypothetical protein GCM10011398_02410 [Virgibacillus oceani]